MSFLNGQAILGRIENIMSRLIKKLKNRFNKRKHGGCEKTNCPYYNDRICPGDLYICLER